MICNSSQYYQHQQYTPDYHFEPAPTTQYARDGRGQCQGAVECVYDERHRQITQVYPNQSDAYYGNMQQHYYQTSIQSHNYNYTQPCSPMNCHKLHCHNQLRPFIFKLIMPFGGEGDDLSRFLKDIESIVYAFKVNDKLLPSLLLGYLCGAAREIIMSFRLVEYLTYHALVQLLREEFGLSTKSSIAQTTSNFERLSELQAQRDNLNKINDIYDEMNHSQMPNDDLHEANNKNVGKLSDESADQKAVFKSQNRNVNVGSGEKKTRLTSRSSCQMNKWLHNKVVIGKSVRDPYPNINFLNNF